LKYPLFLGLECGDLLFGTDVDREEQWLTTSSNSLRNTYVDAALGMEREDVLTDRTMEHTMGSMNRTSLHNCGLVVPMFTARGYTRGGSATHRTTSY